MYTKQYGHSLLRLCLLMGLTLVNAGCGVPFFPDLNPAPPIPQTPDALPAAVLLTPQNMERIEPLYQFSVPAPANNLLWSPDSRLLAVQTVNWPTIPLGEPLRTDGLVLWNLSKGNGQQIYSDIRLSPTGQTTSSLAFSVDGQTLASQEGATFYLWDTQQNRATKIFTETRTLDAAEAVGIPMPSSSKFPATNRSPFSPDGKLVITTHWACGNPDTPKLELFDAASGNKLRNLEGCYPFTFSHDSQRVASLDWDKQDSYKATVLLSNLENGQVLRRFEGIINSGKPVIFAPDDKLLAGTGYEDGVTYLWDGENGKQMTLHHGNGNPTAIAFSPDGRFLAIGTSNGFVQIWGIK